MLNSAISQGFDRTMLFVDRRFSSLLVVSANDIAACLKRLMIGVGLSIWVNPLPAKAEVPNSANYFIGDLGGIPVKIFGYGSSIAKYDSSSEKMGPLSEELDSSRDYSSKINTYVFLAEYPEMKMMLSQNVPTDASGFDMFETKWIAVKILSGSKFPGLGFMEKEFLSNRETKSRDWWNNYKKITNKKLKLDEYHLIGVNPKTGRQVREGRENDVVYIFRDSNEKVRARIDCHENLLGPIKCTHKWSMEYEGMAAQVIVIYRLEFLHDWSNIQRRLTKLILDFRVDPAVVTEVPVTAKETATPPLK